MAQELNDYKYIIVPKKFEDFKRQNQYQTSTLVKHLFSEKGFEAVYADELPTELKNNRCLGLTANFKDESSMFTTKAKIALEDCNGREIFSTKEGKSKEKDYRDSYSEALRDAFTSFNGMNYAYNGKAEESTTITVNMENDVKKMDAEKRKEHTSVNRPDEMVEQEATLENQRYEDRRPIELEYSKAGPKQEMIEQEATRENQGYKDRNPVASDLKSGNMVSAKASDLSTMASATLYAQAQPNGYQLVDSTPKIRMKIHKTSMPDFYLADAGGTTGVVFQKNGTWFFEYYSGDKLMTEELSIKF